MYRFIFIVYSVSNLFRQTNFYQPHEECDERIFALLLYAWTLNNKIYINLLWHFYARRHDKGKPSEVAHEKKSTVFKNSRYTRLQPFQLWVAIFHVGKKYWIFFFPFMLCRHLMEPKNIVLSDVH